MEEKGLMVEVNEIQVEGEDWRQPLIEYLSGNNPRASRALKLKSINFVAIDYFTKWVEAKPMRTIDQYDYIC